MTDTQRPADVPSSTPHPVPSEVTATSAVFYPTGGTLVQKMQLLAGPLAVFAAVIGVWYLLSWRFLAPLLGREGGVEAAERLRNTLLPYPHDIVQESFLNGENLAELLGGLWLDVKLSFLGLAIAAIIGITGAVAMSQAKWIERSFYPYAVFVQTVPILALVPLIGLFFGYGFGARLLVVVIISLFPIITNTLFGLRSAERGLHDIFTLHEASRWTRFVKLQLPASIPAMMTGFQISAGLSVIGAIVGDFFFGRGERGLGNLIQFYVNRLQPEQLWGALAFSTVLGLFVFVMFGWLRTRLTASWYEGSET
jgi:NitT/TauT family transport system permease protein